VLAPVEEAASDRGFARDRGERHGV
jgi:hypothetical protein